MVSKMLRGVLVAALLVAMLAAPRRAAAGTDNLEYIIPAAVTGVVAVVIIVAILMADRSEPDMELAGGGPPMGASQPGLKLAPSCPITAAGRPLLCW